MHTYSICFQLFPFKRRLIANKTASFKVLQLRFACPVTPGEILDYPMEAEREFELNFVCEPFAYLDAEAAPVTTGHNAVPYDGTANAPCVITLTNQNDYPISNVTVSVAKRRT